MDRRSFMGALVAAPFLSKTAEAVTPPEIRLLIAGQSLGVRWMPNISTAEPAFMTKLAACGDNRSVSFLNVSVGNTAALQKYCLTDPDHLDLFWLNNDFTYGPMLNRAFTKIAAATYRPNVILWTQGESDSLHYDGADDNAFVDSETTALQVITTALATACGGSPKIFVQRLGPRFNSAIGANDMHMLPGMDLMRIAQDNVVSSPGYYWGAQPTVELPLLPDGIHPTPDAGFTWIGGETAQAMVGRI